MESHGHTPQGFSKRGEKVARKLNIPFVYEVRGFWEDTKVGLGKGIENSKKYLKLKYKETMLMKKADVVITLGQNMRKELIYRGINSEKIKIVPNAVNTNEFTILEPDLRLKTELNLQQKKIIGYIGSIRKIEGIEILLQAISLIKRKFDNIVLILAGSYTQDYFKTLKKMVADLKLDNNVLFVGKIPHQDIKKYYSISDMIVIPRINIRVTRLVTPLKPLEAMAMGKIILTSDLPALRELVKPGVSGDLFQAENPEDLAKKIVLYLKDYEIPDRFLVS